MGCWSRGAGEDAGCDAVAGLTRGGTWWVCGTRCHMQCVGGPGSGPRLNHEDSLMQGRTDAGHCRGPAAVPAACVARNYLSGVDAGGRLAAGWLSATGRGLGCFSQLCVPSRGGGFRFSRERLVGRPRASSSRPRPHASRRPPPAVSRSPIASGADLQGLTVVLQSQWA